MRVMRNYFRPSLLSIASLLAVASVNLTGYSNSSVVQIIARFLALGGIIIFLFVVIRGIARIIRAEKDGDEKWLNNLVERLLSDPLTIFMLMLVGGGTALVRLTSYLWLHREPGLSFYVDNDLEVLILLWAGLAGWIAIWLYKICTPLKLSGRLSWRFFDTSKLPKFIKESVFWIILIPAVTAGIGAIFFAILAVGYYLSQIFLLVISPSALWIW